MQPLNLNDVVNFVEENIGDFHKRRADNLQGLKLTQVLKRKNPYLFKAKNRLSGSLRGAPQHVGGDFGDIARFCLKGMPIYSHATRNPKDSLFHGSSFGSAALKRGGFQ